LFHGTVNCYIALVKDKGVIMDYIWNGTDRRKLKYLEKDLSQYQFVHQKSHMNWPQNEPVRLQSEAID
jgi:hypothetical protein